LIALSEESKSPLKGATPPDAEAWAKVVWEPPAEYKVIRYSDGDDGVLFFPWELSNQDYIRRVFDATARGMKAKILQLADEAPQLVGVYAGRSQDDLGCLLLHLMGGSRRQERLVDVVKQYAVALDCDAKKLEASATLLIKYSDEYYYVSETPVGRKRVEQCFAEAKELLSLVKSHAMAKYIIDLERQYEVHMVAKVSPSSSFQDFPTYIAIPSFITIRRGVRCRVTLS